MIGCDIDDDDTFENEGSLSNPVVLTVGTAHSGTIGEGGTSYYRFTTTNAGVHTIGLTNTKSDLSWDLYSTPDFWTDLIAWCDNHRTAADEIGPTSSLNAGTTYYLLVDEWEGIDGTFTLTVTFP